MPNIGELAAAGTRDAPDLWRRRVTAATQADGSLLVTDGGATFTVTTTTSTSARSAATWCCGGSTGPAARCISSGSRTGASSEAIGDRIGFSDPFRALGEPGNNYFVVKTSFWLAGRSCVD